VSGSTETVLFIPLLCCRHGLWIASPEAERRMRYNPGKSRLSNGVRFSVASGIAFSIFISLALHSTTSC